MAERPEHWTCDFGCGPDPNESYVGGPGFSIIPACHVHGWICSMLDQQAEEIKRLRESVVAEIDLRDQADKAFKRLRKLLEELRDGNILVSELDAVLAEEQDG